LSSQFCLFFLNQFIHPIDSFGEESYKVKRDRERERERMRQRERQRQRDRETKRDRDREKATRISELLFATCTTSPCGLN
jgi:serine/threonine protein kinase KIN1/2